ncbi:fluoride efflux transporter CrcB [Clostridium tyrobutyricum]|uniref:fluoride efflux transporter CrcB n=1 Tax=Clostridium tyrobutyricum TaxID=1519 RepID=UPI001C395B17|nr:fluoride efflux transporter CrcB [Clostridium tyrobutyricum]MBV4418462.1 fluoride efflux transporter CrcB [Clostridium tyrobutyricum]
MNFLIVGMGGMFGSLTRYSLGQYIQKHLGKYFPIGTIIINITGALVLGVLNAANLNPKFYILLCDGFLGAYTTFSTFMFDGIKLFDTNSKINAISYILITIVFGILAYMIGYKITNFFI